MGGIFKIVASLLVIGGAGAYLLGSTLTEGETLTYFHNADEVIARPDVFLGQRIRIGGRIEKGSILQKKGTLEYRFDVRPVDEMIKFPEARGKTITVAYTGIVPDTFKEESQVIVTGSLLKDGTFSGKEVVAKCPSKYEAAEKTAGQY